MKRDEIMKCIKQLALSQGFYGRLLESLMELEEEKYDEVMSELEAQNFGGAVDLVVFLEC